MIKYSLIFTFALLLLSAHAANNTPDPESNECMENIVMPFEECLLKIETQNYCPDYPAASGDCAEQTALTSIDCPSKCENCLSCTGLSCCDRANGGLPYINAYQRCLNHCQDAFARRI